MKSHPDLKRWFYSLPSDAVRPAEIFQKFLLLLKMFLPGIGPGTFRVEGERDNHYTTEKLQCNNVWKLAPQTRQLPTAIYIYVVSAGTSC